MAQFKADVCSGPVRQVGINAEEEKRAQTGSRPRHVSTNNVVFRASLVSRQGLRFDPYFNFIGGEDFDFFERSNDIGNQHIWVDEALVLEAVTEQRESLAYLFYRHCSGYKQRASLSAASTDLESLVKIPAKVYRQMFRGLCLPYTCNTDRQQNTIAQSNKKNCQWAGLPGRPVKYRRRALSASGNRACRSCAVEINTFLVCKIL